MEQKQSFDAMFIELVRVVTSVLGTVDENGMKSSALPIDFVAWALQNKAVADAVSPELNKLMCAAVAGEDKFDSAEKLYFFPRPRGVYPPWITVDIDASSIFAPLESVEWVPKLSRQGFLRMECMAPVEIRQRVANQLAELTGCKLLNDESEFHITTDNHPPENDMEHAMVEDFVAQYNAIADVKFVALASTVSLNWESYSKVFVVRVASPGVDAFVKQYNAKFQRDAKPSLHMTFGGVPRTICPPIW